MTDLDTDTDTHMHTHTDTQTHTFVPWKTTKTRIFKTSAFSNKDSILNINIIVPLSPETSTEYHKYIEIYFEYICVNCLILQEWGGCEKGDWQWASFFNLGNRRMSVGTELEKQTKMHSPQRNKLDAKLET